MDCGARSILPCSPRVHNQWCLLSARPFGTDPVAYFNQHICSKIRPNDRNRQKLALSYAANTHRKHRRRRAHGFKSHPTSIVGKKRHHRTECPSCRPLCRATPDRERPLNMGPLHRDAGIAHRRQNPSQSSAHAATTHWQEAIGAFFSGELEKNLNIGDFLTESRLTGISTGAAARKLTVRLYGRGISKKNEPRSWKFKYSVITPVSRGNSFTASLDVLEWELSTIDPATYSTA